jgi:phytoene synthase
LRDRDLVRLYWPAELRPAFDALLDIDEAMAGVVAKATEPALAAIKLAWWRERLQELDEGKVAAEPRLQAAAMALLPRGINGGELAQLEEGWGGMLYDPPDGALLTEHGTRLFQLGARLLNVEFDDRTIGEAGRLFAGVDAARRGFLDLVPGKPGAGGPRIARAARPLTALGALAARDLRKGGPPFEPEATPGRALALLIHWLTGRVA